MSPRGSGDWIIYFITITGLLTFGAVLNLMDQVQKIGPNNAIQAANGLALNPPVDIQRLIDLIGIMNDPGYNLNTAQVDFLYSYLNFTLNFLPTVEEFTNLVRVISESNCSGTGASPATLANFFSKFGGPGRPGPGGATAA